MHYANGREVKVGDKVVGRDTMGLPVSGIIIDKNSSDSCNIAIVPIPGYVGCSWQSKFFNHVDDAFPPTPSA